MRNEATPRKSPSKDRPAATEALFRAVSGSDLQAMLGGAILSQDSRLHIQKDPHGNISPRIMLAKSSELQENYEPLDRLDMDRRTFLHHLKTRLPDLSGPQSATLDEVHHITHVDGRHFFHLSFDEKSEQDFSRERNNVWRVLENMTGSQKLYQQPYQPNITIIKVGARPPIPREALHHITGYIEACLPIDVTLEPLYDPTNK